MKKYIVILAVALMGFAVQAQTNATATLEQTEKKGMSMELQLGGSGVTTPTTGETEFGLNVSLSLQPLKAPVWFGVSQELGWSPTLAGATDLYSDYSIAIVKDKLYLNTGWSVGVLYDRSSIGWRSGPEVSLEYYTTGNAFIIAGANYDLFTHTVDTGWVTAKDNGLRYFFGVGIAF